MTPAPGGLRILAPARPLPVSEGTRLVGVAAEDLVHFFSSPPASATEHLAVDGNGDVVVSGHVIALPPVHAAASRPGELLLVCTDTNGGTGVPRLVRADPSGSPFDQVMVTGPGELRQWPEPAYEDGTPVVAWVQGSPAGELWTAAWDPSGLIRPEAAGKVADDATPLRVASGQFGVLVAYGTDETVVLRRLGRGVVDFARDVGAGSRVRLVRVASVGEEWWVAWLTDSERAPVLARFDADLVPVGPPQALALTGPGRLRDVTLAAASDLVAIAVQWGLPQAGAVVGSTPSGRPVRAHAISRQEVVVLLGPDGSVGKPVELVDPGPGAAVLAWLGDRLIAVHGEAQPMLTVLGA